MTKTIKDFLPEGRFGDFLAKAQGRTPDRFASVVDGTNPIVFSNKQPKRPFPLKNFTRNIGKPEHKAALKALFAKGEWKYAGVTYTLYGGTERQQRDIHKRSHAWSPPSGES